MTTLILVGRPGNYTAYTGVTRNEAVALHVAAHGAGPWDVKVIDASVPFWVYDADAL